MKKKEISNEVEREIAYWEDELEQLRIQSDIFWAGMTERSKHYKQDFTDYTQ